MASESNSQVSDSHVPVISVLEEVIQQYGTRLEDVANVAPRNTDEASLKRNEAARWLRKTVGVVAGKDLPAEPSEEDFRHGLRSGKILCLVLNKVQPGSVRNVVQGPSDSVMVPDGAALSAYKYFENIKNFLAAIEEMGIPTFEASDLEQGGNSSRIVQCVLALKSYSDWKKNGGIGTWKYVETSKPPTCSGIVKPFTRRNSEPFMHSISRTTSLGDKSVDSFNSEQLDLGDAGPVPSLHMLVRAALLNKKQEEIPTIVESMLTKVTEKYERRLASQNEQSKSSEKDMEESVPDNSLSRTASCDDKSKSSEKDMEEYVPNNSLSRTASCDDKVEVEVEVEGPIGETIEDESSESEKKELHNEDCRTNEEQTKNLVKQKTLVEQQQQYVLELKHSLHSTKVGVEHLQMMYQEEFNNLGKHLDSLAYAASGYQRVLEENRKLHNQVQDLKGRIRVYCRIRPTLSGQSNGLSCIDHIDDTTITVKNGKEGRKSFTFNKIFSPSVTQAEVFNDTRPLIRSVLDGYNVCIFAYGQTGSGKTYTMSGSTELTEEGLGVNYRALSDLFDISDQRKETISYDISVQMFEIYNDEVRDLLAADCLTKILEIRNDSQNGINVPDANLVHVSSTSDVMNLMNLGQNNHAVFSATMNDRSSRSHSCLTVHVQGKDLASGNVLHGCMHLVDLAGSERVDQSEATGDQLKEAQHIDKSLSALGDVITSLASRSSHVPYENSKLTQLLQDSLGGQAKALMFVHISPEYEALGETTSTLEFAERVATVELGAAKVNKDSGEVKELKEQIASLKEALATAKKDREPENMQHSQSVSTSPAESFGPSVYTTPVISTGKSVSTTPDISTGQSVSTTPAIPIGQSVSTTPAIPTGQSISTIPAISTGQSVSTTPAISTGQSVSTSPAISFGPSVSTTPAVSIGHSVSTTPAVSTGHSVSTTPAVSTGHSVSTTPAVSTGHSVSTTPAVSTGHSVSTSPAISANPETNRPNLGTPSSLTKWQSSSDQHSSVTTTENGSSTSPRRKSLEIQDILANPDLWPPLGKATSSAKVGDKKSASAKWGDKVMVNKQDNLKKDRIPAVGDVRWTPTRVYPEQKSNKLTANKKGNQGNDQRRIRSEVGSTDGSSDHDAGTSDCSENDSVWQSSIPKKQQPSEAKPKNTEIKRANSSPIPSPSTWKQAIGSHPNKNKPKRKTGYPK